MEINIQTQGTNLLHYVVHFKLCYALLTFPSGYVSFW